MKICFLDGVKTPYTSQDLYTNKIRGAENIIINLSSSFSKMGHKVIVYNNCVKNLLIENVYWKNINYLKEKPTFDIAITNNDIRLLDKIDAKKKLAISHSIQTLEKFVRKKQLLSYLYNKPKIILLGDYHYQKRFILLRLFGSFKTDWAVDNIFINRQIEINNKPNNAIFTSHSDRNLDLLVKIWRDYIFPRNLNQKLFITPLKMNLKKFNIYNRMFSNKYNLIKDLINARLLLIPGHKAELFCISAEEGRELCIPIVTLGIGSLKERVLHGETGFIANNEKEFSYFTDLLFNDDNLYQKIRINLFKLRGSKNWPNIAKLFLKKINE